jgi:hypothetical protein
MTDHESCFNGGLVTARCKRADFRFLFEELERWAGHTMTVDLRTHLLEYR